MSSSRQPEIFVQLDERAFRHGQTTADFAVVSDVLLGALDVGNAEGVEVTFDDEEHIARIRGLQSEDCEKILQVLEYNGGGMGPIRLIPNPYAPQDTASENGC